MYPNVFHAVFWRPTVYQSGGVFSAVSTSAWYKSSIGTPSSLAREPYLTAKSPNGIIPSLPPWT
jgi:hypothetical protein